MLQPKKQKFRKSFARMPKAKAFQADRLNFGEFGLMSLDNGLIKSNQIDAARKAIVGYTKRRGKLWIRIFPDLPVTRKPSEVKMGKGKGDVEYYVAGIKKGKILFEIGGIDKDVAAEALRRAGHKLPVKVKIVGV